MMQGFGRSATQIVEDVLGRQRAALLSGDLAALEGMADTISQVMERLRNRGGDASEFARIRNIAAQNARLLEAAMAGVAQARGQLSTKRSASLNTYDAYGRTQSASHVPGRTLSRR